MNFVRFMHACIISGIRQRFCCKSPLHLTLCHHFFRGLSSPVAFAIVLVVGHLTSCRPTGRWRSARRKRGLRRQARQARRHPTTRSRRHQCRRHACHRHSRRRHLTGWHWSRRLLRHAAWRRRSGWRLLRRHRRRPPQPPSRHLRHSLWQRRRFSNCRRGRAHCRAATGTARAIPRHRCRAPGKWHPAARRSSRAPRSGSRRRRRS